MESTIFKVLEKESNKLKCFFRIIHPKLNISDILMHIGDAYDYVSLIQISYEEFQDSQESLDLITYHIVLVNNFNNSTFSYKRYLYEILSCNELMNCIFTHFMYVYDKLAKSKLIDNVFKNLLIDDLLVSKL